MRRTIPIRLAFALAASFLTSGDVVLVFVGEVGVKRLFVRDGLLHSVVGA
jgi:hypothetical protein